MENKTNKVWKEFVQSLKGGEPIFAVTPGHAFMVGSNKEMVVLLSLGVKHIVEENVADTGDDEKVVLDKVIKEIAENVRFLWDKEEELNRKVDD